MNTDRQDYPISGSLSSLVIDVANSTAILTVSIVSPFEMAKRGALSQRI